MSIVKVTLCDNFCPTFNEKKLNTVSKRKTTTVQLLSDLSIFFSFITKLFCKTPIKRSDIHVGHEIVEVWYFGQIRKKFSWRLLIN